MGAQRSVFIVGGGIGGLVAALSLHRAGVLVRVYESTEEIRALGVGINLLPHAVRELTEVSQVELEEIANRYKRVAGFDRETLNA